MKKRIRPLYTYKESNQTLKEGLEEYYAINPSVTDPRKEIPEFGKILLAHDISHVVYGCDTNMYDELKILPLSFWTSDFRFKDYINTRKDPKIKPAIDIMYKDLIAKHGILWLYSSIFLVLPLLMPELIVIWFKTRGDRKYFPFFGYDSCFDRSLLEIRQEFGLLEFLRR
jgi:hypothetical protein